MNNKLILSVEIDKLKTYLGNLCQSEMLFHFPFAAVMGNVTDKSILCVMVSVVQKKAIVYYLAV